MLKKGDSNQQLVYYQVRHESRILKMWLIYGSIGRHWDIHNPGNRDTTYGKMEKEGRYGDRQSPRCACYGYIVLVDNSDTRIIYNYIHYRRI